jgi:PAS domain S-box-containing protein
MTYAIDMPLSLGYTPLTATTTNNIPPFLRLPFRSSGVEACTGMTSIPRESNISAVAARLRGPALALALLALGATLLLWLLPVDARRESHIGNLLGTLVFITAAAISIAVLCIRSFLRTGAWPVLWLGAGSLAFGLSVPLSNLFLPLFGVNAGVTMHNLGAFIAGALHVIGAFFAVNHIPPQDVGPRRHSVVRQVFGGVLILMTLIALGAALGRLPPFFIQGQGGTPLRQMIVGVDVVLFLIAGLVFLRHYALDHAERARSVMIYWYALGLLLISLGLAGILLITATGTPLNWLGRASQWLGGLYLLVAALVTFTEARARRMSFDEVLASYFLRGEAHLRHLLNSIPDAIVFTDREFRITYWNGGAEVVYGWRSEEVLGRHAREIIYTRWPDEAARDRAAATLVDGGSLKTEVIERHRDGHEIVVLSTVSAVRDDRGQVIGAVAINRDITERRAADEEIRRLNAGLAERAAQLEASNRELEAFAYSVSHDLRAPLRGMAGYAQALEEDCTGQLDATGQEYVRQLRVNAQRMGELIDDLLALARVGRQQVERVPVDPAEIARAAWDELRAEWEPRTCDFRVAALPPAMADPTLVKQVYSNLLSNAVKFTRRRDCSVIEIGFEPNAGGMDASGAVTTGAPAYFVRDNGIGFDVQHVDKVFGLFTRLHRAEEYEGTGVGLAIVQRIAERHGGRVWAASQPDRGATFYFTLGDGAVERGD